MFHSDLISGEANQRYRQLLEEAEAERLHRRIRQMSRSDPGLAAPFWARLTGRLRAFGRKALTSQRVNQEA